MQFIKSILPETTNDVYIMIYTFTTICMLLFYAVIYLNIAKHHGEKYLPLVVTVRNFTLSLFLIYFYNPLRTKYEYGRALPIFATAAGISLLLTIDKFDVLSVVHFGLYGKILEKPNSKCIVDHAADAKKALQVSKTIQ